MSHTNSTANYNLPQFLTSDKPAWLTDVNNAYSDIDAAIHAAQIKADTAYTDAGNAQIDATRAINDAAAADAKGSGAIASIESNFDPTTIYPVGAKVMYNSLLYRCIVAIVTPGPWTGSDNWERITVDSLISASDSKIGALSSLSTTDKTSIVNAVNEVNNYKSGDIITFNYQQMFCRIDTSGTRISVFIPLSKFIPSGLTTRASGNYSVYFYDGTSLLSNHDIANDNQSIQVAQNGVILTITLPTALPQTLGYGAVELRNTFTLTIN